MPTDVPDVAAVDALAERAIERFGSLDVWVNNAAVAIFARSRRRPSRTYGASWRST